MSSLRRGPCLKSSFSKRGMLLFPRDVNDNNNNLIIYIPLLH